MKNYIESKKVKHMLKLKDAVQNNRKMIQFRQKSHPIMQLNYDNLT